MLHGSDLLVFLSPSLRGEQLEGMGHVLLLFLLLLLLLCFFMSSVLVQSLAHDIYPLSVY